MRLRDGLNDGRHEYEFVWKDDTAYSRTAVAPDYVILKDDTLASILVLRHGMIPVR